LETLLLIAILTTNVGVASQYSPGVMEATIRVRQAKRTAHHLPKHLPEGVKSYVAIRDCSAIGEFVLIRPVGGVWEKALIVDCASKTDSRKADGLSGYQWMTYNGVMAEIDYRTAVRWDTVGRAVDVEMTEPFSKGEEQRWLRLLERIK